MKTKTTLRITLLAALFGHAHMASAALLAYDPFNQAVGNLNGTSSSGGGAIWTSTGQNWDEGSNNAQVVAGSLSYGSLATSGNRVNGSNLNNNAAFRNFGTTLGGNGSNVWMSFLIAAEDVNTGVSLFLGPNGENNFMGAGDGSGQNFGLSNPGVNPDYDSGIARGTGAHFYVIRFDQTNDTNTVWIDPDFSSLGTGAAPTGGSTSGALAREDFTWDRIRLGDFNGTGAVTAFDEIRLGDTWADVSPVPEPTTVLLSSLGALALLRRRRD